MAFTSTATRGTSGGVAEALAASSSLAAATRRGRLSRSRTARRTFALEDVTYLGSDDESLEEPTTFDIPSSIRLEARVFDSSGNLWTKVRGATSAQGLLGNEIDARGLRVATIAMPPVDTIVLDKIVYGSRSDCPEGELLTLIIKNESFPGVNTVLLRSSVPGSNLRLASDWTPTPAPGRAATMQLVCDGSAWYEISRVAEVKGP